MVQFKYYDENRNLAGLKTGVLYTYEIWNVSDDKPKFVIRKQSELYRNAFGYTDATCWLCPIKDCKYYG